MENGKIAASSALGKYQALTEMAIETALSILTQVDSSLPNPYVIERDRQMIVRLNEMHTEIAALEVDYV